MNQKLAVISLCVGKAMAYAQHTAIINNAYCKAHGIPFFCYGKSLDESRTPHWSKLLALKNHVMDFDWLVWIDADAAIMNHNKSFWDVIKGNEDYMVLIGRDVNGLNAGVFILKGGIESKNWLEDVFSMTNCGVGYYEQGAIMVSEQSERYHHRFKVIERNLINAYDAGNKLHSHYKHGDFILHAVDQSEENRIACFKPFADQIREAAK